jgi:hypothetical protein
MIQFSNGHKLCVQISVVEFLDLKKRIDCQTYLKINKIPQAFLYQF